MHVKHAYYMPTSGPGSIKHYGENMDWKVAELLSCLECFGGFRQSCSS